MEELADDAVAVDFGDVDPQMPGQDTDVLLREIAFGANVIPTDASSVTTTWTVTYDGTDYDIALSGTSLTLGDINAWFATELAAAQEGDTLYGASAFDFVGNGSTSGSC